MSKYIHQQQNKINDLQVKISELKAENEMLKKYETIYYLNQLQSQPSEIVEKINGENYTRMVVECKETKYTDINLILNTILKEYQK